MTVPAGTGAYESTQQAVLAQLQSGGTSGTQYTDGAAAPTHPIGNQIMYNNAGTETAVSAANPLPVSATVTPAANQRVNAQANDFLAGSIVDLLTLLTLAGTPTDANTVNSLMGRLTKIRDLLNATLAVSAASLPLPTGASTSAKQPALGTAGSASSDVLSVQGIASMTALKTDGSAVTQPVSGTITANAGTNLNTSALALETGGNLAASKADLDTIVTNTNKIPALGQTTKSASVPVTLASDQGQAVNVGTPTASAISVGVSSTTVVTPGATAKFLLLTNDSPNTIYLNISGGAAALNAGVRLNANGGSILFDRYIPSAAIAAISSVAASNLLVEVG